MESDDDDLEWFYRMDADPVGYCYIFNNREFSKDPNDSMAVKLDDRDGTDLDKESLKKTFQCLKFKVKSFDNLTDTDMIQKMKEIAALDHSELDCLAVCILSHGSFGKVYGTNGRSLSVKDLTFHVKPLNCSSLGGKPKLFFLQACQGINRQIGHPSMERDAGPMTETELIPSEGDFLLSYSTVPGFESFRDLDSGSVFIRVLTKCLLKYAGDKDILDILTKVNNLVGKEHSVLADGHAYKQCPAPLYSLRKKVVFTSNTALMPSPVALPNISLLGLDESPKHARSDSAPMAEGSGDSWEIARNQSVYDDVPASFQSFPYEVTVTTGDVPEAETDAAVSITVFGIKGSTPPMDLTKGCQGFKRGQTDTFHMQIDNIAPLKMLRVTMDPSTGSNKSWYLEKIELLNMVTLTRTEFHHGNWMGSGQLGASTSVDIPARERGHTLLSKTTYKITVKTSEVRGAGTDANVYIILFGVNGDSGPIHLKDSATFKDPFEKGHIDIFTAKDILCLGVLYKVRVWHDCKGVGAAWHLSSVQVVDESSPYQVHTFSCDRWLSTSDDDKQTWRDLACPRPSGAGGRCVYEVEVKTANEKESGTFHNGWMVLRGSEGKSDVLRLLNSTQYKILRRGQTDFFTMTCSPLGDLEACTIGAYEAEGRPHTAARGSQGRWQCQDVVVTDTGTGIRTIFPCKSAVRVQAQFSPADCGVCLKAARWQQTHWARARDLKPLLYQISVHTGTQNGAGTDANVFITIFGENGDTGKQQLKKKGRDLFERGKSDQFTMEALDLGTLSSVRVEHDNSGVGAKWYLEYIEINSVGDDRVKFFHCNAWLTKMAVDFKASDSAPLI